MTDLELPYSRCVAIAEESAMPFSRDDVRIGIVESPTYPFVELRMHRKVGELERTARTSVSRHTTPDDFRRQCDGAWKFLERQLAMPFSTEKSAEP
jgi:hypothetical protein